VSKKLHREPLRDPVSLSSPVYFSDVSIAKSLLSQRADHRGVLRKIPVIWLFATLVFDAVLFGFPIACFLFLNDGTPLALPQRYSQNSREELHGSRLNPLSFCNRGSHGDEL
jgi:hypothetical protein